MVWKNNPRACQRLLITTVTLSYPYSFLHRLVVSNGPQCFVMIFDSGYKATLMPQLVVGFVSLHGLGEHREDFYRLLYIAQRDKYTLLHD